MYPQRAEVALGTYKTVRERLIKAGDTVFGPGFISMAEYYFFKKTGYNPFAMLFSEPKAVYDEWIQAFKGEEPIRQLFENAVGPNYVEILENVKRNDGLAVWKAMCSEAFAGNSAVAV
jgi:hypothetical protein